MLSVMWLQETEDAGEENRSGTGRRARMTDPNHTICLFLHFAFLFKV